MITSISPFVSGFVARTCSITPSAVATPIAMGKLVNRAIAAAASPRISNSGPSDSGVTTPLVGMIKVTAKAATAPATAQENTDIARVGTPAVSAASALEAAARTARPVRDFSKKNPRATSSSGDNRA